MEELDEYELPEWLDDMIKAAAARDAQKTIDRIRKECAEARKLGEGEEAEG